MSRKQTPSDFLKQIIGRPVVVKLNSGVDYRGVLACLDGYMNIALEQTEEYVNGQLKNKYGDAFIRGNNEAIMVSLCNINSMVMHSSEAIMFYTSVHRSEVIKQLMKSSRAEKVNREATDDVRRPKGEGPGWL
ncbi:hypothetical protein BSL78_03659 [Apostichopus japonicus]|uniref:U6 snRNA-associated Sm-like protein LSm6 n=1 Tax=Stichopus japonicus TaxID=307972 RepID=A0A2G8LGS0_STIJA|nr:hypothetical protein BSL78_03659 [Apostichopus japonicus]